jgi:hypothetical protein
MATDRPDTFGVMNESTTTSRSPDSSRPTPTKRNLACERCWKRKQKVFGHRFNPVSIIR